MHGQDVFDCNGGDPFNRPAPLVVLLSANFDLLRLLERLPDLLDSLRMLLSLPGEDHGLARPIALPVSQGLLLLILDCHDWRINGGLLD